ncbi:TrmH family RNA methyltransferase [Liquorilactobacillus sicerae]|uniref:TrmH family RNA methyltransferase n=1 Tax=Liquorilactobacillus sicerae TaxID=1416943 RepID=UPI0024803994|nr:RNA methyltransferase [Liquorilactobacillus sicerae]
MKKIESIQNGYVKNWTKLKNKKGRKNQQSYLLEGWHLVKEALLAQVKIQVILVTADFKEQAELTELITKDQPLILISPAVAEKISDTDHPQGIFAVVALEKSLAEISPDLAGKWLLLDNVQDPGNIGTMVRTADAAGFTGVVFGRGTADLFQPKVVRSMQGSQFHIKLFTGKLADWLTAFAQQGYPVWGTEVNAQALDYRQVKRAHNFALIMGNEGNGVDPQLLKQTTQNIYIPIQGQAESLNVAVAAGILMFQLNNY